MQSELTFETEVVCSSQIGRCPSTAKLPSHLSCRTFVQAECTVLQSPMAILFGCCYVGRYPPGSCCRWTLVSGMGMVVVSIYRKKCCCGIAIHSDCLVCGVWPRPASVIRHGITPARLGGRVVDSVVRRISRSEVVLLLRLRQVRHDDGRLQSARQTKRNIQARIQVGMIPHRIMTLTKDADVFEPVESILSPLHLHCVPLQ
jgi:hypothetical protein